jgi:hypothetical protein
MLLLKEMVREGWVKASTDYSRFKAQLEQIPQDNLPQDRRFNPLAINPYVLFKLCRKLLATLRLSWSEPWTCYWPVTSAWFPVVLTNH